MTYSIRFSTSVPKSTGDSPILIPESSDSGRIACRAHLTHPRSECLRLGTEKPVLTMMSDTHERRQDGAELGADDGRSSGLGTVQGRSTTNFTSPTEDRAI